MENMKRLRFHGVINFMAYHSHLVNFVDGEEKDVPEEVAKYLLEDFGDYFEEVKTKDISEPVKHRMITTETKTKKMTRKRKK